MPQVEPPAGSAAAAVDVKRAEPVNDQKVASFVNFPVKNGATLLHMEAGRGRLEHVRVLLSLGADPNKTDVIFCFFKVFFPLLTQLWCFLGRGHESAHGILWGSENRQQRLEGASGGADRKYTRDNEVARRKENRS